jgi:hypothetical protein
MNALEIHPVRYKKARAFADSLFKFHQTLTDSTHLTEEKLGIFAREFIANYNESLELIPVLFRPENSLAFADELTMSLTYAGFRTRGGAIVTLAPERTAALLALPASQIRAGDIKSPLGVFHLAFGRQPTLELSTPGYFVDGAYLNAEDPDKLEITLTTSRPNANYARPTSFILQRDLHYSFDLRLDDPDATLNEAVDREVNDPDGIYRRTPTVNAAYADKVNSELSDSGADVRVVSVGNTAARQSRQAWNDLDTLRHALPLIANALTALHADPGALEVSYPADTPQHVLDELRPGCPSEGSAAAERKLERMGFPKLLRLGPGRP